MKSRTHPLSVSANETANVTAHAAGGDRRRTRVLATCGSFEPGFRGGGPVRSLAAMMANLPEHIDLLLVTRDRDLGCARPYPGLSGRWVQWSGSRVFYLNTGRARQWLRLWRALRRTEFDLLYVNSLWAPVFTVVPVVAARLGLIRAAGVLIAPRGELSAGALSLKAGKKRLFLRWWEPFLRGMDPVWHASSRHEAADVRSAFPWARVEINPDQIQLPAEPMPAAGPVAGPARFVFISRISPMKNLELALRALRLVRGPAEFDIYGPREDAGYWARCEALIALLPPTVRVRYRGDLPPAAVPRTFHAYDAFVFPTLGENFGHVIAESLFASCPVICSDTTPWTAVLDKGGGRVVRDLTAGGLAAALQRVVSMSPEARLRARQAAGDAYRSWRAQSVEVSVFDQILSSARAAGR
jgi:glycosyltransferase involved in cell wall biosynthesis